MKLLKSAVVATSLALSLSSFSTTTAAGVCLGMACMYNKMTPIEGINATVEQTRQALNAITDNASEVVIIDNIKDALKVSKEINANDKVDRNRQRANGYLKKARKAVRNDDLKKATEDLKEAEQRFLALKGMLSLTQADRTAQQTHMLDR
ncbi:MAG: hypothetical protein KAQ91_10810 [Methylococcales bacterium]|nr:hypothetical protein [Methylococcales bacterium]